MNLLIPIYITIIGISSVILQIVLLREFINFFAGNELVIGLVLGSWTLIDGLGAYCYKYFFHFSHAGGSFRITLEGF